MSLLITQSDVNISDVAQSNRGRTDELLHGSRHIVGISRFEVCWSALAKIHSFLPRFSVFYDRHR